MKFLLLLLSFGSIVGKCHCHFLDDYFAIGNYLPEIWLEYPFMGYLEYFVHFPASPTRGVAPSYYDSTIGYPSPTETLDGLTCEVNDRNFRFWWNGPFYGTFDSISIVMHVKQPDGLGPIWADQNSAGNVACYIAHGYEEETGRLDEVLSKHRVHARCGDTMSRVLAVENCPVDQGVQLALVYDHLKNKMRLYCDDRYDEVDTMPGLKPLTFEDYWNFCAMNPPLTNK